ncbi:MAG: hypothetical protein U5L01_04645 [Rheinheimera sp.]|nr:hypothetical protein [Rheinheimera sp.]
MKKTVLVTGFAPFGGETLNPSWQVAKQLHGWQPIAEVEVVAVELACAFLESAEQLSATDRKTATLPGSSDRPSRWAHANLFGTCRD